MRACLECGKPFTPTHHSNTICSENCRQERVRRAPWNTHGIGGDNDEYLRPFYLGVPDPNGDDDSTFWHVMTMRDVLRREGGTWRIAAIRNMLPSSPQR